MSFVWKREKGSDIVSLFPAVCTLQLVMHDMTGAVMCSAPRTKQQIAKVATTLETVPLTMYITHKAELQLHSIMNADKTVIKQKLSALHVLATKRQCNSTFVAVATT
jgi:hypothetical protein